MRLALKGRLRARVDNPETERRLPDERRSGLTQNSHLGILSDPTEPGRERVAFYSRNAGSIHRCTQRQVARQTRNLEEYRQAMAVLLPADLGASLEQIAALLGVGRATVHRLQTRFRAGATSGGPARKSWGGRRRALMSPQEEKAFLAPWAEQAKSGAVLVVSPLRAALA